MDKPLKLRRSTHKFCEKCKLSAENYEDKICIKCNCNYIFNICLG